MQTNTNFIGVDSEVGTLQRLMIHSPDSGLGKVIPSKAQDWLFEDIIHLKKMQKEEYDFYVKLLLYFLDKDKIAGRLKEIDAPENNRGFYKPDHPDYFNSDKVIDPQKLLADILEIPDVKLKLVSATCAVEQCSYDVQEELLDMGSKALASTLISGVMPNKTMIFPPVPNFIFTRDIGIVINNYILLNKPAKIVRLREALIMRYIFFNHQFFADYKDKIIEIPNEDNHFLLSDEEQEENLVTLEGGDLMTVSPSQILIGCSERTSEQAINQVIKILFKKDIVKKVSVVQIPPKRDFMHIDTVFTQVRKDLWVLFDKVFHQHEDRAFFQKDNVDYTQDRIQITRFTKGQKQAQIFNTIEELLDDISQNDLGSKTPTKFIYSGDGEFPYAAREQWTDACNVLALKEGVVIGYDRNVKTANAFKKEGFRVVEVEVLLEEFEKGITTPEEVKNTLILLPSAELSRARGGAHCMSLPLSRGAF